MNDYERIAFVIRHLDARYSEQPDVGDLASRLGLSVSHFHRLFRRWAGVTPKDFLQCLTVEFARERLRACASVLDAALEAGLSGPGRLHDLMVTLEAASPGEVKRRGAGLTVGWGGAGSPFGECTLGWTARGICHLAFVEGVSAEAPPRELAEDWPEARFERDDQAAQGLADRVFQGRPAGDGLRAWVHGTPFQLRVWRALLGIPPGGLASYGSLARALGEAGAARAAGLACAHNPVAFLIPCHRVIRETGAIRGYRWGTERKRAILAWEGCRFAASGDPRRELAGSTGPSTAAQGRRGGAGDSTGFQTQSPSPSSGCGRSLPS